MLTREALETQLDGMKKQFEQRRFDLEALGGAIQFCQHLLALDAMPEKPKPDNVVEMPAPAVEGEV